VGDFAGFFFSGFFFEYGSTSGLLNTIASPRNPGLLASVLFSPLGVSNPKNVLIGQFLHSLWVHVVPFRVVHSMSDSH
jgi:hypothetical protein